MFMRPNAVGRWLYLFSAVVILFLGGGAGFVDCDNQCRTRYWFYTDDPASYYPFIEYEIDDCDYCVTYRCVVAEDPTGSCEETAAAQQAQFYADGTPNCLYALYETVDAVPAGKPATPMKFTGVNAFRCLVTPPPPPPPPPPGGP